MRMQRVITVFLVMFGLLGWLTSAAVPPAASQEDQEKLEQQIADMFNAQAALSMGQHGRYHAMIDTFVQKYPDDEDFKSLHESYHQTLHDRMELEEQILNNQFFREFITVNP